MARKKKEQPLEEIVEQIKPSYKVIKQIRGSINRDKYSFEVGQTVYFNKFEVYVFKDYIKEA
jgi:hypothetical protein